VNNPHPKKEKPESVLCLCGCGNYTKLGNKYVNGHNARGDSNPAKKEEVREKISKNTKGVKHIKGGKEISRKLCGCGTCGQYAEPGRKFIQGHNSKGDTNPRLKTKPEPKLCKCDCGVFAELGNDYIHGHNKGHQDCFHSEETKEVIRQYTLKQLSNNFNNICSKPQFKLFNLVKEEYPNAMLNFPISYYLVDVAIPERKIAIEYDGSYWHKDKEKDLKCQQKIEAHGWSVIRYVDRVPTKVELMKDIFGGSYGTTNS
jgi:very-short-patch-repair endonuclease